MLLIAVGAWMYFFYSPPPPKIVMATGTTGLAYYKFGQIYAEALKREGVEVDVRDTRGSLDNLARLHSSDPEKQASVALIQGGIIDASNASDLESLGTVFYEPLWLFRRRNAGADGPGNLRGKRDTTRIDAKACRHGRHGIVSRAASPPREGINGLRGKTIAVGPNGSGIQPLACELLWRHRITRRVSNIRPMSTSSAVTALLDGTIDAAFIVASWDAPDVQRLLHDERIELSGFPQADAYADFYPYLHKAVMHRGAIDFVNDQPPADVTLIATKASLIVRKDLHPAIQYLLLNAARQIHSKRSPLQEANEFPSAEAVNVPLSAAAQQFYKSGVPYFLNNLLKNYFPLWIAEPINDLLIPVLIPVLILVGLGVLAPLFRLVVILFNWVTQRPVFRLLFDVMALEAELASPKGKENAGKIALRLDALEHRVDRLLRRKVAPLAAPLLILRQHIDALRERLNLYAYSMAESRPDGTADAKAPSS